MASTIENEVKQIILDISGLPGTIDQLDNGTTLSALGFDANMCKELARTLDDYAKSKKPGAHVGNSQISEDMTIQDVIDLITEILS